MSRDIRKSNQKLPRGVSLLRPGAYRARVSFEGRQHLLGVFHTVGDASTALAIARGEIASKTFAPPSQEKAERRANRKRLEAEAEKATTKTVDKLAEEWLQWLERQGRARSTVYTYRRRYEAHIKPTFGTVPAASVTPAMVAAWLEDLDSARGNGVSRPVYMTLQSMFRYATGKMKGQPSSFEKWATSSPCQESGATDHKPVRKPRRQKATPEEIQMLAAEMPEGERLAVLLAAWCALRIGEVLALRRRDFIVAGSGTEARTRITVEWQIQARGGGLAEVPPKSDAGKREVPVPAPLVPVIDAHMKDFMAPGADALVFPRKPHGDVWLHPNSLRTHFNAALAKVNTALAEERRATLDGFTFHMLRHTGLSHVGEAGATLAELKKFGGHSDDRAVATYQHADHERLARLADKVADKVRVPGEAEVIPLKAKGRRKA